MTAVAVATPKATDPDTLHEYRTLARIKRDKVKDVMLCAFCKSFISVYLQRQQHSLCSTGNHALHDNRIPFFMGFTLKKPPRSFQKADF